VYDKCGSYTCQTAKFGKAFGPNYENNFRSRFAYFSVRAFARDCSKHADVVTHPTGSDSGSVSSGWSDRCDRPNCAAKIDIVHVSYRGQSQALPDLLGGRISMMFLGAGDAAEHVRSGLIVPIGIASAERSALLPNVAPLAQQGLPGFNAVTWFGLVGPSGIPANIANAYYENISASLGQPEIRTRLLQIGLDPLTLRPKEFGHFIAGEVEKWGNVIRSVGIRTD
jgi:tripartite-type tricarboxylate transporter receptor subunit TctC